jgi:hypothetical protein
MKIALFNLNLSLLRLKRALLQLYGSFRQTIPGSPLTDRALFARKPTELSHHERRRGVVLASQ